MRKETVCSDIKSSGCISLQNDLPFSMSTESDKEPLLFPLCSDDSKDSRPEQDIYRMIGKFIQKEADQESAKVDKAEALTTQNVLPLNTIPINRMINTANYEDLIELPIDVKIEYIEGQYSSSLYSPESTCNPVDLKGIIHAPVGIGRKRGPYKKHSQQEKEDLVNEAKKHGVQHVIKTKGIARKTICRWMTEGVVRRHGGGRQVGDMVMEGKLMTIIKQYFCEQKAVLPKHKIQELAIQLSTKQMFSASHGWYQKFYMRHRTDLERMVRVKLWN